MYNTYKLSVKNDFWQLGSGEELLLQLNSQSNNFLEALEESLNYLLEEMNERILLMDCPDLQTALIVTANAKEYINF